MPDNGRDKLIERIKKLIALSTSPNENEALAAAEKVQSLLAEYNLTMSDVDSKESEDPLTEDKDLWTDQAAWVRPLLNQIANLYFCGYFFVRWPKQAVNDAAKKANRVLIGGGHASNYLRHHFVGAEYNVIACKNMGEYLISTMERLCKEEEKKVAKEQRSSFRVSFMNTCAARLCFRLQKRQLETMNSGVTTESGTNLPALRSMYETAQDRFKQWAEENVKGLKTNKNRTRIKNAAGAVAGAKAGDSIGLDTQVSGTSQKRLSA